MMIRSPEAWLSDIVVFLTFLILLGIGLVIGVIVFAYLRGTRREKLAERDMKAAEKAKFRPDGRPFPPSGRGLCEGCERVSEKVYFIPSGTRLCPKCYDDFDPPDTK